MIGLKERVALTAEAVIGKIHQQFPQGHYIKMLLRHGSRLLFSKGQIVFFDIHHRRAPSLKGNGIGFLTGVDYRTGRLFAVVDEDFQLAFTVSQFCIQAIMMRRPSGASRV